MYSIIQASTPNRFNVIEGEVSPAGYPLGIENKDWTIIKYSIDIEEARELIEELNKIEQEQDY